MSSGNARPADVRPDTGAWHRLHPLSPVIRAGRALAAVVIVFAGTLLTAGGDRVAVLVRLGLVVALALLGVVSWLVTRWRVQDGDLLIETGVLRRSSIRLPLSQMQAADIIRPALARVLGLSELRLRMGGSTGKSTRLAYLNAAEAEIVRSRLLALARGLPEDRRPAPEQVLLSVPVGRLIGSILLSGLALVVIAIGAGLIVTWVLASGVAAAIISSSVAVFVGLLTVLWRRLNGGFRLTVAAAPDGLRLRSGLLSTTAETIPSSRVQAVRMVEPLLWRPLGWCRLEVDVAGRQRAEGESSSEGRQLRAVLPVGNHDDAWWLLGRILPDAARERIPAPVRARLKSPLRYPTSPGAATRPAP